MLHVLFALVLSSHAETPLIGSETRKFIGEFAAERGMPADHARRLFAATGVIGCAGRNDAVIGSVQLVGKNNLIATARHNLLEPKTCTQVDLKSCGIVFHLADLTKEYRIKKGSVTMGPCDPQNRGNTPLVDWAVFELEEEVKGVNPYLLPSPNSVVPVPMEVLLVSGSAERLKPRLPRNPTPASIYNVQSCRLLDRQVYSNIALQSDCNVDNGVSGSATFYVWQEQLVAVAIIIAAHRRLPSGSSYNSEKHFTYHVPIEGEFLNELHRRVGTRTAQNR